MHLRRFAALLIGAWLTGGLLLNMLATQSFRAADRLLAEPSAEAAKEIRKLGQNPARSFLRYYAGELNRSHFENWEQVQLGLGVLLLGVLWTSPPRRASLVLLAALMLLAVVISHWGITPEMARLGRRVAFPPAGALHPDHRRFWDYHNLYSAIEAIKLVMGGVVAVGLLVRGRQHSRRTTGVHAASPAGPAAARSGGGENATIN